MEQLGPAAVEPPRGDLGTLYYEGDRSGEPVNIAVVIADRGLYIRLGAVACQVWPQKVLGPDAGSEEVELARLHSCLAELAADLEELARLESFGLPELVAEIRSACAEYAATKSEARRKSAAVWEARQARWACGVDWHRQTDEALRRGDVPALLAIFNEHARGSARGAYEMVTRVSGMSDLTRECVVFMSLVLWRVGWDYDEALEEVRARLGFPGPGGPDTVDRYVRALCGSVPLPLEAPSPGALGD